jgi:hypothetical protein
MAEKKKLDVTSLSPAAQQIVATKKVSGDDRLKGWFTVLREVAAFDNTVDELRAKASKRATIFLIISIALLFLGFFTFGITAIVAIPCIVLTIVYFVKKSKLSKIDLSNEFRTVLIPFLQTMSEDIQPKGRIALTLDMAGPSKEKIVSEQEIPPGRFRKVRETIRQDPWCRLSAPLTNGARLILNVDNVYVTHDRYWRNPRGKSKHKAKWKKQVNVTAGLIPSGALEFDKAEVDSMAVMDKMKLKEKADSQMVRLTRKFKFKAVNQAPEESVTTDDLVGMFFHIGSALTEAQPGS